MQKIILFDMDGTLINSGLDITISINAVRESLYALPPLDEQYVIRAINAPERNLAHLFYTTEHYEPKAKEFFERHYYEQCIQNVHLYEGVMDMLHRLKKDQCRLSVATNAPSTFASRMLGHLGVDHFFDTIIGADKVEHPKPHPQMLHKLLDSYAFDPSRDQGWMVGDSHKDMQAALNANISSIFTTWGFTSEGEGDFLAHHPSDLPSLIL